MSELAQQVVVTVAALGAVAFVVRRFVVRRTGGPACPSCTSGAPCEPSPGETSAPKVEPLTFIRPHDRRR